MSALDTEPELEDVGPPAVELWKTDKNGKPFVGRRGSPGIIYQRDGETVEQARLRDSGPSDPRPRSKKKQKMPAPPREVNLKELELVIAEALKAPAIPCATFGDQWAADHFTVSGPYLARNLVLASEHNPWLRRKLEEAATGEDAMMKLVSLVGVGGALFAYAIPPVIWWFNLPVPPRVRDMFGMPPPRDPIPEPPPYAAGNGAAPHAQGTPGPFPQGT